MDRREFLKFSAAGGALVATSALPSLGEADQKAEAGFAGRGAAEQLSIHYVRVRAGATKPFAVLHISDTHLTAAYAYEGPDKLRVAASRSKTFGGMQEMALADSLKWARGNCDFVLHTGDPIDWQSKANFDLVRKYFGPQMFGAMGNHEFYTYMPDEKITSEETFKARSWTMLSDTFPIDPRFASKIVNGVNFICLDDAFGTVMPEQVARFRAEAKRGLPIVLAMHVPFFSEDIWTADVQFWCCRETRFGTQPIPPPRWDYRRQLDDPTTRDFIAYLREEPLLKAIFAGHVHFTMQDWFSPTAMQYVVGGNFLFHAQEILFT